MKGIIGFIRKVFIVNLIICILTFTTTVSFSSNETQSKKEMETDEEVDVEVIEWQQYMGYSGTFEDSTKRPSSKVFISSDGKNIKTENTDASGTTIFFSIPSISQKQEFNFNCRIETGNVMASGMLLRVERVENTLQGYMLGICSPHPDYPNIWAYDNPYYNSNYSDEMETTILCAIYEFKIYIDQDNNGNYKERSVFRFRS